MTSVSSSADNETWTYDADGNVTQHVRNGVTTTSYYGSASNRLDHSYTGTNPAVGYHYDANGNLLAYNGGPTHAYDPFNRQDASSSTSYEVGPEGQRLEKSNGGGTTYFAPGMGGALLAEDDSGAWSDYVYLNGRPVGMIRGGVYYDLHTAPSGRVQAATRPDQYTVWVAENYAYDRKVMTDLIGGMSLGFPGQYLDAEDGLWYNGSRDFDSGLGRYIEPDPLGLGGGINSYVYAGNNPISYIDPFGLSCNKALDFLHQVNQQFVDTNKTIPGTFAIPGMGIITSRAVAQASGSSTLMGTAAKQVSSLAAGTGEVVPAVEWAGALRAASLNYVAVSYDFEGGLYVGSALYTGYSDLRYGMPQDSSQDCDCKKGN